MLFSKLKLPEAAAALPGRTERMPVPARHHALNAPLDAAFDGLARAMFAMGCFWGAEKKFWVLPGVVSTAVGYAGGFTANPTYKEVCSGGTGHAEVVRIVYDAQKLTYLTLLKTFWENHDPTQGMRQGNDVGTQYRSAIYAYDAAQRGAAEASKRAYGELLLSQGFDPITTEIADAPELYFAEEYHQQYLSKNPHGYCGLGGTGVSCPTAGVHAG